MEKLAFDIGVKEYRVNGHSSLRFNPTDQNLYVRFVNLYKDMPALVDKYEVATKIVDDSEGHDETVTRADAIKAIDTEVKTRLAQVFGEDNDFDAIFNGVNVFAGTDTGQTAIENFMDALLPAIEKSAEVRQKIMKDKVSAAVDAAKLNRDQRRAMK